jgi:hypothetical protein
MTRVYLSGPMSGIEDHNFPAFHRVAAKLRAQGYDVINPAELNPNPGMTWEDCLRVDIRALCTCNAIAMIPGWQYSRGAQLEQQIAHRLGLSFLDISEPNDFNLRAHLQRQIDFSRRTFGPGNRLHSVVDHIRKELVEVIDSNGSLAEWVDVIILAFDGAWRSGNDPDDIIAAILLKQARNERRTWPDWRTAEPGKAIEHVRQGAGK